MSVYINFKEIMLMKAWRFFFRPSMIKIMLLLAFLVNFVGWDGLKKIAIDPQSVNEAEELASGERARKEIVLRTLIEEMIQGVESRKTRGESFSPADYFGSMKRLDLKEKELRLKNHSSYYLISKYWTIINENFLPNWDKDDLNRAVNDYKEFVDPGREPRDRFRADVFRLGFRGVVLWFFLLYLKTMPVAFVLFLVWIKEEQGKLSVPRPINFLLLLIIYPVVLIKRLWHKMKQSGREIYVEAELRRTKKQLFTYLSDEELTRVKSFARSNLSFSHWKMQLAKTGLRPRHGLVLALVVTFVFLMLPRPSKAEARGAKMIRDGGIVLEQMTTTYLPRMSIDADGSQISQKIFPTDQDTNADCPTADYFQVIQAAWIPDYLTRKYLLFREIFHIPIWAVHFEMAITSIQR
ncbi:MAG: hypothetical protein NT093_04290 [Candidatus Moranbacteria bacterium]|nr:hypothetical protein [Candidatus Moranbacteria bacterium]